jgi:serine phosphatase RsbU (regulator of sigma subunit)/Tfp pilus assembly protein PilF
MLPIYKYALLMLFGLSMLSGKAQFSELQLHRLDSLQKILDDKNSPDTSVVGAYVIMSEILYVTNIDTLTYLCSKAKKIADKNLARKDLKPQEIKTFKRYLSVALNNIGYNKGVRGDLDAELDYFEQSLKLKQEIEDEKGIAISLNNIGSIYKQKGQMTKALEYYTKSLKIKDKLGDKRGVALSYSNIGVIYESQEDLEMALDYYERSVNMYNEIDNKVGEAVAYNNMALVFYKKSEFKKSLEYNFKSLELRKSVNDRRGLANSYNNLGLVYREMGDNDKALEYYLQSIAIKEENGDIRGLSATINNTGYIYYKQGNIQKAKQQGELALKYAQQVGVVEMTRNAADLLDKIYYELGDYKKARDMNELYFKMRDSITNKQIKDEALKQNLQYEYEKEALADSLSYEETKRIEAIEHNAELEKQSTYTLFGIIGLVLVLVFSFFVVNRLRVTKAQKAIIEDQHEELEEKHQEIRDSIQYAKRIQSAILPPNKVVKEYLQDSFILYKPKDIVAGDFYWLESVGNKILFAAADCTGHGVPGAMVSVVCNNGLNRSVREHGLTDPGKILDKTREIVIREFEKSEEEVKDGMDIALCSLEGNKLEYAGAHNPLWIIRDGEIIETKANKQPIGRFDRQEPYTTHSFDLQKGDTLYIFSDGYVDQFGGEKGKKLKARAFRELLLSMQNKTMEQQRTLLDEAFENWRGDLEQIDDVCVIGIRV